MPGPIDDGSKGAPTGVAAIKGLVETANSEDEKLKGKAGDDDDDDDDAGTDDNGDNADDSDEEEIPDEEGDDADEGTDDDAGEGDDDANSDDPKDDKGKTTRRFTQFAGDGKTETYISNLEKGYQDSSAEGIRLNTELKQSQARVDAVMKVVASDADVAAKVDAALKGTGDDAGSGSGSDGAGAIDNPYVSDLKARWTEKSDEEIDKFIEANPEVISDPKIAADVKHYMSVLSNDHLARTGKLMTGGEAMAAAYRTLGLENKLGKQNLAQGAKKNAAPARPQGGKKKPAGSSKQTFTPAQIAMATRMGKDQAWLEKNAK